MARTKRTSKDNEQQNSQAVADEMTAAPHNIYDMLRDKAKSMSHAAAKLPDDVWQKFVDVKTAQGNLMQAKLYVENYMMGNIKPSEFAQIMAEDDALRYTISDLCRERLEPVELNVERNDRYVDVGAGIKTFWTEIRVPLPSEVEAARDLRNIYFGIEAGRATAGAEVNAEAGTKAQAAPEAKQSDAKLLDVSPDDVQYDTTNKVSKRHSIRDALDEAKRRMAEKAIEKLTPLTEDKKETERKAWLATDEGKEYKSECTRKAAQNIENVVMNIEAGKAKELPPEERRKALAAAGVSPETLSEGQAMSQSERKSNYSKDDLNRPMDEEMKVLFDQIMKHVNQEKAAQKQSDKGQEKDGTKRRGLFKGKGARKQTEDQREDWERNWDDDYDPPKKDESKKEEQKAETQATDMGASESLFTADDEALMHYYMAGEDESDYYAQLAEDMASYQSDDMPGAEASAEETPVELSAADVDMLFEQDGPQLGKG